MAKINPKNVVVYSEPIEIQNEGYNASIGMFSISESILD